MLDQIRYIFITLYKATIVKELSQFEKIKIQNIIIPKEFQNKQVFQNILKNILQELYNLYNYNYLSKDLIIFTFLKIMSSFTDNTNNQIIRREKKVK